MKSIKKALFFLVLFSLAMFFLVGCNKEKEKEDGFFESFAGKKMGVVEGTIFEDLSKEYFPKANIVLFNSSTDLANALEEGKLDSYMLDESVGRVLVGKYSDQYISSIIMPSFYAYVFNKDSDFGNHLRTEINSFIEQIRQNGILKEIDSIWFGTDETLKTVDYDSLTGENGTIRFAISTDTGEPFVYLKDGKYLGYELDILVRFCREKGYALTIDDYNFSALFTAVESGKDDIGACSITITDERKELVDFSVPTYEGGVVVVTKGSSVYSKEYFADKKIGVPYGSAFGEYVERYIPTAKQDYYNSYADLSVALAQEKIAGYVGDESVIRLLKNEYKNQEKALLLEALSYGFMFPKDEEHQNICNLFNVFLKKCRENGTLEELDNIWYGEDESLKKVDLDNFSAENGVLELAVSSDVGAPFAYVKSNNIVGYDVDLAARFCREYGYGLKITDYNITGVLAATSLGKADFAGSSIAITPERQENSLMSDSYYEGGIVITVLKRDSAAENLSFKKTLSDSLTRTFIREDRWKLFVSGLSVTFLITVTAVIFGSVLGFGAYLLTRYNFKFFNGFLNILTNIMGKTPIVVILMILYYIVFGNSDISNIIVSMIGFTILFACSCAELLKMGAGAVDKGQTEAALSQGYTDRQAYLRIIFPQSIEHFITAYKSEVVSLLKGTAFVGYIAVQDLTRVGDLVRARTYEAFFPLIATAVLYYLLAVLITRLIKRINVISNPRRRNESRILKGVKK